MYFSTDSTQKLINASNLDLTKGDLKVVGNYDLKCMIFTDILPKKNEKVGKAMISVGLGYLFEHDLLHQLAAEAISKERERFSRCSALEAVIVQNNSSNKGKNNNKNTNNVPSTASIIPSRTSKRVAQNKVNSAKQDSEHNERMEAANEILSGKPTRQKQKNPPVSEEKKSPLRKKKNSTQAKKKGQKNHAPAKRGRPKGATSTKGNAEKKVLPIKVENMPPIDTSAAAMHHIQEMYLNQISKLKVEKQDLVDQLAANNKFVAEKLPLPSKTNNTPLSTKVGNTVLLSTKSDNSTKMDKNSPSQLFGPDIVAEIEKRAILKYLKETNEQAAASSVVSTGASSRSFETNSQATDVSNVGHNKTPSTAASSDLVLSRGSNPQQLGILQQIHHFNGNTPQNNSVAYTQQPLYLNVTHEHHHKIGPASNIDNFGIDPNFARAFGYFLFNK